MSVDPESLAPFGAYTIEAAKAIAAAIDTAGAASFGVFEAVGSLGSGAASLTDGMPAQLVTRNITLPNDGKVYSLAIFAQALIDFDAGVTDGFIQISVDGVTLSQSSGIAFTPGTIQETTLVGFFRSNALTGDGASHVIDLIGAVDGDGATVTSSGFFIIPIQGGLF